MAHISLSVTITFHGVPVARTDEFYRACDTLAGFVMQHRDHVGVVVELERTLNSESEPSVEELYADVARWRARAQAIADQFGAVMYWGGVTTRQLRLRSVSRRAA